MSVKKTTHKVEEKKISTELNAVSASKVEKVKTKEAHPRHKRNTHHLTTKEESSLFVKWSKFFIEKWRVSIILLVATIIAGVFGLTNNQRQDFPAIPANFIVISAAYPGASPENVEKEILIPIEESINDVEKVIETNSTASNSFGVVSVEVDEFEASALDEKASEIQDKVSRLSFPENVEPTTSVVDAAGPAMYLAVYSDSKNCPILMDCAVEISSKLEKSSDDIQRIDIVPSDEFKVEISFDNQKLLENGLSYQDATSTVEGFLQLAPGGTIDDGEKVQSIVIESGVSSIEDLEQIPLTTSEPESNQPQTQVRLGEVATITRDIKDQDSFNVIGYVQNGENVVNDNAIILFVYKTDNGDSVNISDAVRGELERQEDAGEIVDGTKVRIIFDSADDVKRQISSLISNAGVGLILILVILLFFINLRAALVVSSILPLVFLITLFALFQIGFTINILTLFAMILALGVMVDNAIVIAEGMVFELEDGADPKTAALRTIFKLGPAVTSATATTLIVFVPFALLPGIIGQFMKFIPYTIIIMLIVSYILALTITPLFGRLFLKKEATEEEHLKTWQKAIIIPLIVKYGQIAINKVADSYKTLITAIFGKWYFKLIVGLVALVVVVLGLNSASSLEGRTFPNVDSPIMTVDFKFPAGTVPEVKQDVVDAAMNEMVELDHFKTALTLSEGTQVFGIFEDPVDRDVTIFELQDELNDNLESLRNQYPEVDIEAKSAQQGPPSSEFDTVVEIRIDDLQKGRELLAGLEDYVTNEINQKSKIELIENSFEESLVRNIVVNFDQDRLSQLGLNSQQVSGIMFTNFSQGNSQAGVSVTESGVSEDIVFKYDTADTQTVDDVSNFEILPSLKVSDVGTVETIESLESIERQEGERILNLGIKAKEDSGLNTNRLQADILEYLGIKEETRETPFTRFLEFITVIEDSEFGTGEFKLQDDAKIKEFGINETSKITFGGAAADQASDFGNFGLVAILAIIGVYVILVNQFNSYSRPLLIMFTVVVAFSGVFPGLLIFNESLNFISGLGVVALVGIAVNDAIVFIDTLLKNKKKYKDHDDRDKGLIETGYQRFKPIISTTTTTILGILPLTVSDPFWRGLGIAIIAGLLFSTIATLVLVPLVYQISADGSDWIKMRWKKMRNNA